MRVAKYLAHAGVCSRRDAEKLIAAGRVSVNGKTLASPALNVSDTDAIALDGKPIAPQTATRLWLYHKPAGVMTTHRDPKGRPTVFDALPKNLPRVVSVGRLDFNSEGLLLLTTDGDLAGKLMHPSLGWKRCYRARVYGKPEEKKLAALRKGVTLEGMAYRPVEVAKDSETKSHTWLTLTLTEGKNREIRKLLEHIGTPVTRLIRVSYGPFSLGDLKRGEVREMVIGNWSSVIGN